MSKHAGFAGVVQARESAAQDALQILHAAGVIPVRLAGERTFANPIGSGTATVRYDLFNDVPRITFSAAAGNRIRLRVRLVGTCTVTGLGPPLTRTVIIRVAASALPVVTAAAAAVRVGVTPSGVSVDSLALESADAAAPLPGEFMAIAMSPVARAWLNTEIRTALAAIPTFTPPLALPFAGVLGPAATIRGTALRVFDGAISVGVSLNGIGLGGPGDVAQMENLLGESELAVCVHPAVVRALSAFARAQAQTAASAAAAGARVESLNLDVGDGILRVTGRVTRDPVGASFNLRLRPLLGTPDVYESYEDEYGGRYTSLVRRGHDEIWFDVVGVDIDDELPWWARLVIVASGIVLLPLAHVVIPAIASIIGSVIANIEGAVGRAIEGNRLPRTQRVALPGTTAPMVDFTVSMIRADLEGIRLRSWMRPDWGEATRLSGPQNVDVEDRAIATWSVAPARRLFHPADPLVRVRWQVRRQDTNAVVLSQDRRWIDGGAGSCSLDLAAPALTGVAAYSVHCRIFRPAGSELEELFSDTLRVRIADRLDRSRPYVRWAHEVHCPVYETTAEGLRVVASYHHEDRVSAIHRTAVPGRCRFAASASEDAPLQYMDALPFPREQIVPRRAELCDYCFFGGPDKSVPLV